MDAQSIRFYLDEQMPVVIAEELKRRGIDAVTVRDLQLRGDSDENHLKRATIMRRCICTMDDDFLELAALGIHHEGIVLGIRKDQNTIGNWVRFIVWLHNAVTREQMTNRIEFLRLV